MLSITPKAMQGAQKQATDAVVAGPNVRRMTRGIQIKEDTFATLQVITTGNKNIPLVDAGSRSKNTNGEPLQIGDKRATDIYSNFLLQNITEERVEKQQILETFGEPYIFLFGERARLMSFQGILANTQDFNWEAEWWHNYDNYLRGTRCVEEDAMAFLHYDNTIIGGYIVATGSQKNAQDKNFVQFQFQMFVTYYAQVTEPGNPYPYPGQTKPNEMPSDNDHVVSNADAWRPNISPLRDYTLQLPTSVSGSKLQIPDLLLAVMMAAKDPFQAAWRLAGQASALINGITQNMSGGVVKVPYGFAGTMAYDEVDLKEFVRAAQPFSGSSVIQTYTTYGQNDDEFVNLTTQYNSAIGADGVRKLALGTTDLYEDLKNGNNLVNAAADKWGIDPLDVVSEAQKGPLSSFISKNGMGMIFIGNSSDTERVSLIAAGTHDIPFMGKQRSMEVGMKLATDVQSVGLNTSRALNLVSSLILGKLTGSPLAPPQYR
jgi:hypothetical protein